MIGTVTALRRNLHDRGILPTHVLPRPVVSVGNLSAGGTGKTPHVAWLARKFLEAGFSPCILSRGYGREGRGVVRVSDGRDVLVPARTGGDEPVLLARLLPGVPVVVGESRREAGIAFLEEADADLFLLDDGFQHLALHREADLVLVDCREGFGNGRTLPFGPLRESPLSISKADAVVVTKCPSLEAGRKRGGGLAGAQGLPVGYTALSPTGLVGPRMDRRPLPGAGWDVAAFSALARNEQFLATLRSLDWTVSSFRGFRDHHRFTAKEIGELRAESGGRPLITTMKDLVRLPEGMEEGILALDVDVQPLGGTEEVFRTLERKVRERSEALR